MKNARKRFLAFARLLGDCYRQYGFLESLKLASALHRATTVPGLQRVHVPGLVGSITLRGCTSDVTVFDQIFVQQELNFALAKVPATIIDGGANIGLSSLYLARKYPGARILAVEFEASNFALLQTNVAAYPNISCVYAGIWSHVGRLSVSNPEAEKWAYAATDASELAASGDSVPAVTVQALLEQHAFEQVDFLKLDIEGSEFEVFSERPAWLARVQAIAIELHDGLRPGCGMRFINSIAGSTFRLRTRGEYVLCEFDDHAASIAA